MPVGEDSTIRVSLLRSVPGPNLDFVTFNFQMPMKGSVWATAVSERKKTKARMKAATNSELRITTLIEFVRVCRESSSESTVGPMSPANVFILATSNINSHNQCFATTT